MRFVNSRRLQLASKLGLMIITAVLYIPLVTHAADSRDQSTHSGTPCLGRAIVAPFNTELVFANGEGLPVGSGIADEGAHIFEQRCQNCHGEQGIGATSVELVGKHETLTQDFPVKAIGSYWPAAPTLFSFIQQAMPPQNTAMDEPRLSNDESYAVVAYLLYLNGLWPEEVQLDAKSLGQIKMPNLNGFDEGELAQQASSHQLASVCEQ